MSCYVGFAGKAHLEGMFKGRCMVCTGKDAQQNGSVAGESPPDAGPPAPGNLPMPSFIRVSLPFTSSSHHHALSTCPIQLPSQSTPDDTYSECTSGWAANGSFHLSHELRFGRAAEGGALQ